MPKLRDGVPQVQEIRIMPPKSDKTQAFFKPLMVLKQNVTKPMIENIEIDIPEKGKKYSTKPSVEVIEGDHREMLEVSKGQAVVENAEQRSQDHPSGVTSCSYNFLLPCNFDHSLKRENTGLYKHHSKSRAWSSRCCGCTLCCEHRTHVDSSFYNWNGHPV